MSQGFDHTVHVRDKKTGKVVREDHYAMSVIKGQRFYKRAGKWFDGAGAPCEDPQAKPPEAQGNFTRSQIAKTGS